VKQEATISVLGYALLGLIAREPLSGYDLARRMQQPVGFFWHARHSQIYPELTHLEAQGLVTYQVVAQKDRPDKKLYAITEAGQAALRQWVIAPLAAAATRDELVLRAYCLWLADPDQAIALFREQAQRHAAQLARYQEIQAWMEREWGASLWQIDSPQFSSYAALRRGIGNEREYAEWCNWVADQIEQHRNI
jgi:DNA-binding PadR family transcriptional regulator